MMLNRRLNICFMSLPPGSPQHLVDYRMDLPQRRRLLAALAARRISHVRVVEVDSTMNTSVAPGSRASWRLEVAVRLERRQGEVRGRPGARPFTHAAGEPEPGGVLRVGAGGDGRLDRPALYVRVDRDHGQRGDIQFRYSRPRSLQANQRDFRPCG